MRIDCDNGRDRAKAGTAQDIQKTGIVAIIDHKGFLIENPDQ